MTDRCTRENDHEFQMEHHGKDRRSEDRTEGACDLRELADTLFTRIRELEDKVLDLEIGARP